MSLPGVSELLRPTAPGLDAADGRQASGREAHPQKITVYLSADEYLDLERARVSLRARGISVDRGRLVREAIAVLLADLDFGVEASVLARRLRQAAQDIGDGGALVDGRLSVPSVNGMLPAPAADGAPGPAAGGLPGRVPLGPQ